MWSSFSVSCGFGLWIMGWYSPDGVCNDVVSSAVGTENRDILGFGIDSEGFGAEALGGPVGFFFGFLDTERGLNRIALPISFGSSDTASPSG